VYDNSGMFKRSAARRVQALRRRKCRARSADPIAVRRSPMLPIFTTAAARMRPAHLSGVRN
jgi:hypothetical protein